jgi:aspartate dehydrogenase
MRIGLIGGGVIGRLIVEHRAEIGASIAGILGRECAGRARALADECGAPFVTTVDPLIALRPDVVVEAGSHDAVRQYAAPILDAAVPLIVLSGGALADDALRRDLERRAVERNTLLYVPSGGIGGLDGLKAACAAGCEAVEIAITKPPAAWKNIPYVDRLGIDLDRLAQRITLFAGTAREGVPLFPANVNIAAVLAMAGIGFDRTRLEVIADPALKYNTHYITIRGKTGSIRIALESVPAPDNPKTALLACYSALAAIKAFGSNVRYGT